MTNYFSLIKVTREISCQINIKNTDKRLVRMNNRNETYILFTQHLTDFNEAIKVCEGFGSLAIIRDRNDQMFLQEWLSNITVEENTWLGAMFIPPNQLIWQSLNASGMYTNWAPSEPYCHSSCCGLMMNKFNKWATFPCNIKARVLCKINYELRRNQNLQGTNDENTNTISTSINNRLTELEERIVDMSNLIGQLRSEIEKEKQIRLEEQEKFYNRTKQLATDFRSTIKSLETKIALQSRPNTE